ncbi:hypothetical protein [Streptomyces luteireticuli]
MGLLRMCQAGGRLLAAGQQVGLSRPDVTPVGLFALANALSWIADRRAAIASSASSWTAFGRDDETGRREIPRAGDEVNTPGGSGGCGPLNRMNTMKTTSSATVEPASPRIRRIAYAGAIALLPYAAMKLYWSLGGTWGIPDGYPNLLALMEHNAQGKHLDPFNAALVWLYEHGVDITVVMAGMGIFLLLGLVSPWGRIFPRWVPFVARRPVPRWLPLTPAWITASIMAPVFGVAALTGVVLAVFGLFEFNTGGFSPVVFYIAYSGMGPYGLALGAAAWSYQRRTRRQAA